MKKPVFQTFFNKNEIITYNNLEDLSEKIQKYKKNEKKRKVIAKNGKKKYLKYFNSDIVSKFIVNKTLDINKKERFIWN